MGRTGRRLRALAARGERAGVGAGRVLGRRGRGRGRERGGGGAPTAPSEDAPGGGVAALTNGGGTPDALTGGAAAGPFAAVADAGRPGAGPPPDMALGAQGTPGSAAGRDPVGVAFGADVAAAPPVSNPFVSGTDAGDDETDELAEPVLDTLQNGFAGAEDFDLWLCGAPEIPEVVAIGYVFVGARGTLVLVPADGSDPLSFGFETSEQEPGTLVNAYADVGVSETLADFRFDGADAFAASSDVFGPIGCDRFVVGGETRGPAEPVSALVQNTVDATGTLSDAWICRGPQLGDDALAYVFVDARGFFVALGGTGQGDPLAFTWTESSPGTLALVYAGGAEETLDGVAFDGADAFDATSSFDGALSCELVML